MSSFPETSAAFEPMFNLPRQMVNYKIPHLHNLPADPADASARVSILIIDVRSIARRFFNPLVLVDFHAAIEELLQRGFEPNDQTARHIEQLRNDLSHGTGEAA